MRRFKIQSYHVAVLLFVATIVCLVLAVCTGLAIMYLIGLVAMVAGILIGLIESPSAIRYKIALRKRIRWFRHYNIHNKTLNEDDPRWVDYTPK